MQSVLVVLESARYPDKTPQMLAGLNDHVEKLRVDRVLAEYEMQQSKETRGIDPAMGTDLVPGIAERDKFAAKLLGMRT